ncbi:alpha/beta hydrolase [Nocardia seriolae]|nr:alpha/beta hydrolase [Nocardia seriolae]QOW37175.1 alpha/beta hydrolase [Nocardia seriolae]QUN21871.1 alpha/beta hydrolase [Nocardia seriolae]
MPEASLYYEVRGNGPLVLFIPGGGGDAASVDPIAELLEDRFTVVSLDPRGYSRSVLDGPQVTQRVEVQSDDVYRLLCHLTEEPALVVGGSSGAIVGLDLLARHPERVEALVAHEPPCFAVLSDAAEQRAMVEEVHTLFRTEGPAAASARFLAGIGGAMKPAPAAAELPPRTAEMWARLAVNGPLMMECELREFTSYVPDFVALAAAADRLVLAVGRETRGCLPYRPAVEIARRIGIEVTEFPGAHNGMRTDAAEFAAQLADTLITRLPDRAVPR